MIIALSIIAGVQAAALVALGVLLIVSRRSLKRTRRALRRARHDTYRDDTDRDGEDQTDRDGAEDAGRPRRRRPRGVAPLAVKTVLKTVHTADAVIRAGIGGVTGGSLDDLVAWARVERPDLARIVSADGQVVLVFSDIEGSTERNAALGDRAWVGILERHNELIERQVGDHHGYVVKNQGDGFMLAFADPVAAVRCCLAVQRSLRDGGDHGDDIRVRMGAHLGTSVRRGDDLFGLDVALASRVADLADGGQIVVSEAVYDAVGEAHGIRFDAPRAVELKGLRDDQVVYAVADEERDPVPVGRG